MRPYLKPCPKCGAGQNDNIQNNKKQLKFLRIKPQKGTNGASLMVVCLNCNHRLGPYRQKKVAGELQKESSLKEALAEIWNFRPELERCPECGGEAIMEIKSPHGKNGRTIIDIYCKECGYNINKKESDDASYETVIPLIKEMVDLWNRTTSPFRGPKFVYQTNRSGSEK